MNGRYYTFLYPGNTLAPSSRKLYFETQENALGAAKSKASGDNMRVMVLRHEYGSDEITLIADIKTVRTVEIEYFV